MPETKTSKKASKRELILDAAGQCFAQYGYDKTTLADIGKAIHLNKASLYYYFKNKEELFIEVTLAETAEFVKGLQAAMAQMEGCEEKVLYYVLARVDRYQEVLHRNRLTAENLAVLEGQFLSLYQQIKEREVGFVEALLEEGVQKGEIASENPHDLAESIFLVSDALKHNSSVQSKVYYNNGFTMEAVKEKIARIVRLVFAGLYAEVSKERTS